MINNMTLFITCLDNKELSDKLKSIHQVSKRFNMYHVLDISLLTGCCQQQIVSYGSINTSSNQTLKHETSNTAGTYILDSRGLIDHEGTVMSWSFEAPSVLNADVRIVVFRLNPKGNGQTEYTPVGMTIYKNTNNVTTYNQSLEDFEKFDVKKGRTLSLVQFTT